MPGKAVQFVLNSKKVALESVAASTTLLDYLREDQRLSGTKEGCAEGDCGACTVMVGRLDGDRLVYETVNSCIRFLASLHGCHIVTIEHLCGADNALHPVQQAMVEHHGSQCGFCTPGIVMSLYALWMENPNPAREDVQVALQGNLCRCTGYEPILHAAISAGKKGGQSSDRLIRERAAIIELLAGMRSDERLVTGPGDDRAILPSGVDDLLDCLVEYEQYTIVSGSTDVGLWVTKFLKPIGPAIFISHLEALRQIVDTEDCIIVNSGVSYSDSQSVLSKTFPFLEAYWKRIAGWQIRNMGTIGGNIANGSPIGDTPPVLIALDAKLVLRSKAGRRRIALEDFFVDYGVQDLAAGEFVERIEIPKPAVSAIGAAYKISKRRDEDISAVAVGISLEREGDRIVNPRIAYGGMAATPKRATFAEAALAGADWHEAAFNAAAEALVEDFEPLTDMRASSEYRMLSAQNLMRRFFLEHGGHRSFAVSLNS